MTQPFGRYLIERRLAVGGMGEVFLARQTGPNGFSRPCVLKRMHASIALNPASVDLFLQEARLTAELSHPHIAQVYDFGKVGEAYYMAMERVDGASLREVIHLSLSRGASLPLPLACRIASQAAQALDAAHRWQTPEGVRLNLVHRDVSPPNILLSVSGAVKLIDFGIARSALEESRRTQAGTIRGKIAYMSPEQIESLPLDGRSDLYSLALVLYELITNQAAIRGRSELELSRAVLDAKITPAAHHRPLPDTLATLLDKALTRAPEGRFQTGAELSAALERVIALEGWQCSPDELGTLARDAAKVRGGRPPGEEVDDPQAPREDCPTEEVLERFSRGVLDELDSRLIREHLDACVNCRQLVSLLSGDTTSTTALGQGEHIGRYVVQEQVGAGAMGVVLRALDPQLNRAVALKLVLGAGTDPRHRARLLKESQAVARVRHANVVAIHDVGLHGDELFLVMELVDGPHFGRWLAQTKPKREDVMRVLVEIGRGLIAIHEAGLVHRDIKPENILVDSSGQPRVTDFGLVHDTGADRTASGLIGTPAYMSPEQLAGERIDAASDQFSFCVLAYEALMGRRPFEDSSVAALYASINKGPQELDFGTTPPPIQLALARGLSPRPKDRFPSMNELIEALRNRSVPAPAGRRALVGALAAGLVAVVGAGAWWTWSRPEPPTAVAVPPGPTATPPSPGPVTPPNDVPPSTLPTPVAVVDPPPTKEPAPVRPVVTKPHGTLSVSAQPSMDVTVDGKSAGRTPLKLKLTEGKHKVLLRNRDEGLSRTSTVDVGANRETSLDWVPQKVPLEVRAVPPQIEFKLYVDGALLGATPLPVLKVWEGAHQVRVVSESGWKVDRALQLTSSGARLKVTEGQGLDVTPRE